MFFVVLNCAIFVVMVWGQTTLTREFKLDVFGVERLFIRVRRNPTFAIMGDNDIITLDEILSTPKLNRDTEH
jgi:predicted RNA-binding protein